MAVSSGQHSYSTMLFFATFGSANPGVTLTTAGNGTWTWLAEVFSLSGLPMNPSSTKLTHLTSDFKAHEKIPGITDAGQLQAKLNYYAALMNTIQELQPDNTASSPDWDRNAWLLQLPDGGQWLFTAFIQGSPLDVPEDDRVTIDVTLEVSGRPIFTP